MSLLAGLTGLLLPFLAGYVSCFENTLNHEYFLPPSIFEQEDPLDLVKLAEVLSFIPAVQHKFSELVQFVSENRLSKSQLHHMIELIRRNPMSIAGQGLMIANEVGLQPAALYRMKQYILNNADHIKGYMIAEFANDFKEKAMQLAAYVNIISPKLFMMENVAALYPRIGSFVSSIRLTDFLYTQLIHELMDDPSQIQGKAREELERRIGMIPGSLASLLDFLNEDKLIPIYYTMSIQFRFADKGPIYWISAPIETREILTLAETLPLLTQIASLSAELKQVLETVDIEEAELYNVIEVFRSEPTLAVGTGAQLERKSNVKRGSFIELKKYLLQHESDIKGLMLSKFAEEMGPEASNFVDYINIIAPKLFMIESVQPIYPTLNSFMENMGITKSRYYDLYTELNTDPVLVKSKDSVELERLLGLKRGTLQKLLSFLLKEKSIPVHFINNITQHITTQGHQVEETTEGANFRSGFFEDDFPDTSDIVAEHENSSRRQRKLHSAFGSGNTYDSPLCSCSSHECRCCKDVEVLEFDFLQTVCLYTEYDPEANAIVSSLTIGGEVMLISKIPEINPTPICAFLQDQKVVLCVILHHAVRRGVFHACFRIEVHAVETVSKPHDKKGGCFNISHGQITDKVIEDAFKFMNEREADDSGEMKSEPLYTDKHIVSSEERGDYLTPIILPKLTGKEKAHLVDETDYEDDFAEVAIPHVTRNRINYRNEDFTEEDFNKEEIGFRSSLNDTKSDPDEITPDMYWKFLVKNFKKEHGMTDAQYNRMLDYMDNSPHILSEPNDLIDHLVGVDPGTYKKYKSLQEDFRTFGHVDSHIMTERRRKTRKQKTKKSAP